MQVHALRHLPGAQPELLGAMPAVSVLLPSDPRKLHPAGLLMLHVRLPLPRQHAGGTHPLGRQPTGVEDTAACLRLLVYSLQVRAHAASGQEGRPVLSCYRGSVWKPELMQALLSGAANSQAWPRSPTLGAGRKTAGAEGLAGAGAGPAAARAPDVCAAHLGQRVSLGYPLRGGAVVKNGFFMLVVNWPWAGLTDSIPAARSRDGWAVLFPDPRAERHQAELFSGERGWLQGGVSCRDISARVP